MSNNQQNYNLGKLDKKTSLRSVWKDEARDFTPWLAKDENLALLSEALQLDNLIVVERESDVGNFSLDILAKEESSERIVVIENQLEDTNHDHLGKLITYAAGKGADTAVWVVKRARNEHRKAIEWLNNMTGEGIGFFLVEVELWTIDGSNPAPHFNVVERPNVWAKAANDRNLSKTERMELEFWEGFREYAKEHKTYTAEFTIPGALPQNWYNVAVGTTKCHIRLEAKPQKGEATVGICIPNNHALHQRMQADEDQIAQAIGVDKSEILWTRNKESRFYIAEKIDMYDTKQWPSIYKWFCEYAVKIKNAIKGYI